MRQPTKYLMIGGLFTISAAVFIYGIVKDLEPSKTKQVCVKSHTAPLMLMLPDGNGGIRQQWSIQTICDKHETIANPKYAEWLAEHPWETSE